MKGATRLYWILSLVFVTMLCTAFKSQVLNLPASFSKENHDTTIKEKTFSKVECNVTSAEKDKTSKTRHKRGLHAKVFAFFCLPSIQITCKAYIVYFFQASEDIVCSSAIPFFLRGPPNT